MIPNLTELWYTHNVKETTLEYDEQLFEEVRQNLGTKGLKATVHEAFKEVLRRRATHALIRQLRTIDGLDLDKPEVMRNAWVRLDRWPDT